MEMTPRRTKLYNRLAKDYLPKKADMNICLYIEGLEARIEALEGVCGNAGKQDTDETEQGAVKRNTRKQKQETTSTDVVTD